MKISIMQCALIVALVAGPSLRHPSIPPGQAPTSNDPLGRRVKLVGQVPREVELQNTTTFFVTRLIAAAGNPPGGFAIVKGCEDPEPEVQPLLPIDSTLGEGLDKLVANDPGYTYSVDDGVVNLLPYEGAPPLLNTHISSFDVEDESIGPPLLRLIDLPEVLKAKASVGITGTNRLQQMVVGQPAPPVPGRAKVEPKKFTLHLRNVTLMGALNALVRAQGRGVWSYTEHICNGEDWETIGMAWW
ncbi:MAG TPA: hypothetical protein VI756_30405 [Blastocatellia bacterium]